MYNIICNKNGQNVEQEIHNRARWAGSCRHHLPSPSPPIHPRALWLGSLATRMTASWGSRGRAPSPSGTIVWPRCAPHHHATCTPALFHATRSVIPRWEWGMPSTFRYHIRWPDHLNDHKCPSLVDLVFALPQAYPAAALDGDHEHEHEDVGSRLHHCQVSLVNNWHSSTCIVCTMCPSGCEQHALRRRASGSPSISWGSWAEALLRWRSRLNQACTNSQSSPAPSTALSYTRSVSMWVKEYDNCVFLFY
jgi:hypothetical protein